MSIEIQGKEVIGIQSQALTTEELHILVALADGKTEDEIEQELGTDITLASLPIRAKLGASTKIHMISRAFLLQVLIPRVLVVLLCASMVVAMDDGYRRERTRVRSSFRVSLRLKN
ncbi:hypothetical protein [Zooshikella ganghwensis]|uniref:HTH luxR-type domain-containing protein n=1 Tax=Zooshikella ganghwensis TaxID=202772 RepID=A0A4P9VIJ5_9GAMM|nr:hypothetical protein [Zooshikella ganghwensis]RDH41472.1 hypothetical protein B9G39_28055 [Zooshikella ganghwensis]